MGVGAVAGMVRRFPFRVSVTILELLGIREMGDVVIGRGNVSCAIPSAGSRKEAATTRVAAREGSRVFVKVTLCSSLPTATKPGLPCQGTQRKVRTS